MTLTLTPSAPPRGDLKPRITVFGVGGAGCNAINNMITKELTGAEFVVANTDAQSLQQSKASHKIQLGAEATEGLGAGTQADVGARAAKESIHQITDYLKDIHMCFIAAGMGGGTGTGAAPVIAQTARELNVLTVGIVTKPFQFEGAKRMRQAEEGLKALQKAVDTLIVIPNQNLFRLANESTPMEQAFSLVDDVLYQGVKGITDLMVRPGLINLDFADVRTVMREMGQAIMGTGEASGENRAKEAAERAIANPLLDEISLEGAKGVLINITGSHDMTLFETDEAASHIREKVVGDADIIVGTTLDTEMEGVMRVSVVATGINNDDEDAFEGAESWHQNPAIETRPAMDPSERGGSAAAIESGGLAHSEDGGWPFHDPQADAHTTAPADEPAPIAAVSGPTQGDNSSWERAFPNPAPVNVAEVRQVKPANLSPEDFARVKIRTQRPPQPQHPQQHVPQPPYHPAQQQKGQSAAEPSAKPRTGLGGLFQRMTGGGAQEPEPSQGRPHSEVKPNPQGEEQDTSTRDEHFEIPAFLRRQAN
ncbi:MAG: cell division protein FtsZ [Rhodobacteraceae bacterium]|nr:cell division protein FtsZ [Paracoccaceae bacterium]